MTLAELLTVTLFFSFLGLAALGLGLAILSWIKNRILRSQTGVLETDPAVWLGAAILIGMGMLGYLWLLAGFATQFTKPALLAVGLAGLVLTHRYLWRGLTQKIELRLLKDNKIAALLIGLAVLIMGTLYLTAMEPPYASDELHYHFPQARTIVGTHQVPVIFEGGYFYGVIPKLMEVIFAGGIAISGYSLAHALHMIFLLGFVILLGGVLTKRYGLTTAGLAMVLILLYDDFTWNATVGFIDAATVSLELAALLLALEWFKTKNRFPLLVAGALIGLALSMKYSPVPTLLAILFLIALGIILDKEKKSQLFFKTLLPFGLLALVFGGYWYIRNAILYQNPFYPLYFGHKDVDEMTYQGLINAIQEFGPRTLKAFTHIPKKFRTFNELIVYYTFYLAPLALLLVPKVSRPLKDWLNKLFQSNWSFHGTLACYFLIYVPYWFFFATHQTRFLMPAIIIGLILTAIILTTADRRIAILLIALTVAAAINRNRSEHYTNSNSLLYFRDTKLHINEAMYALGRVSQTEFLNDKFGCQYEIVELMKNKPIIGNVIDNWTIWHDPSVVFYASPQNRFRTYGIDLARDKAKLVSDLQAEGLGYIYLNEKTKERHLANTDPEVVRYRQGRDDTEEFLLKRSNLIYETGPCQLYQIDFDRLAKDTDQ